MREALRRLRAGEADGIVVAKLDRLTRSVGDLNALIEEAKAGKWNIVALDLGVDLEYVEREGVRADRRRAFRVVSGSGDGGVGEDAAAQDPDPGGALGLAAAWL